MATPTRRTRREGEGGTLILRGTERLLERVSLADLSVEDILVESGTSRGTFYHYFGSKFEVVAMLAANAMQGVMGRISPFLERDAQTTPADALRAGLEAGWREWRGHAGVLRAVMEHWVTVPEIRDVWLEVIARFTEAIAAEIDRERGTGLAPPGTPSRTLAATLLWSTAQIAFLVDLEVDANLASSDAAVEAIVSLWRGAIYGA